MKYTKAILVAVVIVLAGAYFLLSQPAEPAHTPVTELTEDFSELEESLNASTTELLEEYPGEGLVPESF